MKHTFRKCLALVMALATLLSVCVVPLTAADAKCDHYDYKSTWTYVGKQDPTCVEYGGEAYICGKCGERFVDESTWVKPLGHDKKVVDQQAPTALADGWKKWECTRCDATGTDPWAYNKCPNNTCKYGDAYTVYPDNDECDRYGTTYKKCSVCGHMIVVTANVAPKGHTWAITVKVAPACGYTYWDAQAQKNVTVEPVDGLLAFSCSKCGEKKEEVVKAPNEHKKEWHAAADRTCEIDGVQAGYDCTVCGKVFNENTQQWIDASAVQDGVGNGYKVIPATKHNTPGAALTGKDYQRVPATCTDGYEYKLCLNAWCDHKDAQTGNAIVKLILKADEVGNHAPHGQGTSKLGGTKYGPFCEEDAYYLCTVCNAKVYSKLPADKAGHQVNLTAELAPTCTARGYKAFACRLCSYAYVENLDPINHNRPATLNYSPATCAEPAYYWYYCTNANCPNIDPTNPSVGGKVIEKIPGAVKLGHVVPDNVVVTAATCDVPGYRSYTCNRPGCAGENQLNNTPVAAGQVIELTGEAAATHDWVVTKPATPATCAKDGTTAVKLCKRCGKVEGGAVDAATGHQYVQQAVADNCMYKAHQGYVCIKCQHECLGGTACVDPELDPLTGAPTGNMIHASHDLSAFKRAENTQANHIYTTHSTEVVLEPTCTATGTRRVYCDICNYEKPLETIAALEHAYGGSPIGTVPATCTTKGFDVYYCYTCGAHARKNYTTLANVNGYEGHVYIPANTPETSLYSITSKAGANGMVYEFALTQYTHIADGAVTGSSATVDTLEHGKYLKSECVNVGNGDCNLYAYKVWECGCCNRKITKAETFDVTLNGVTYTFPYGQHALVTLPTVNASCLTQTDGYSGKVVCVSPKCHITEKVVVTDTVTNNPHTFSVYAAGTTVKWTHTYDKDHNTVVYNDKVQPASCIADYISESGWCTVCSTVANPEKTTVSPAMQHKVDGVLSLEKVAASTVNDCYTASYDAHWGCTLCDYVVAPSCLVNGELPTKVENGNTVRDDSKITLVAIAGNYNYKAPKNHATMSGVQTVNMACMKDGYTYKECMEDGCSYIEILTFTHGYANHRYTDNCATKRANAAINPGACPPACEDHVYYCDNKVVKETGKAAVDCDASTVVTPKEAHTNKYGDKLVCTAWPENTENKADFYVCTYCKVDFKAGPDKEQGVHGNFLEKFVAPTCVMPMHVHKTCTECGAVFIDRQILLQPGNPYASQVASYTVDKNGLAAHQYEKKNEVKPSDWTKYYTYDMICKVCKATDGKVHKEKPAEVYFSMAVENKFGGSVLVNGSQMAVTIKMQSPTTDIYSVAMSVKFDNKVLEFAGKKVEDNIFGASDVTTAYCDNNGMNTVDIYAYAEKAADGKVQNVTVAGTETLVTLYFEIKSNLHNSTTATTLDTWLDFGDITVITYDAEKLKADNYKKGDEFVAMTYNGVANDADKVKVDTQIYGANCPKVDGKTAGAYKITCHKLADLNGDGVVGIVDAGMVHELVINPSAKYDAKADLNKDGVVDVADFILMKQYMVNKLSYAQLARK